MMGNARLILKVIQGFLMLTCCVQNTFKLLGLELELELEALKLDDALRFEGENNEAIAHRKVRLKLEKKKKVWGYMCLEQQEKGKLRKKKNLDVWTAGSALASGDD